MKKETYVVWFKEKKEKEIIEEVGGDIVDFNASYFREWVAVKLTEEMAETLRKSPKTERVVKESYHDTWD